MKKETKQFKCNVCDNGTSLEEVKERLSRGGYYLNWWQVWLFVKFRNKVLPKMMEGQESHNRLIKERCIAHAVD